jgi:chromosomal replication initiator protein
MEHCASPSAATRTVSERLAKRVGHHKYDMWFSHATRIDVDGERVQVAANSRFVADWIDSHFLSELRSVAHEAIGERARVDVRVAPELFAPAPAPSARGPTPTSANGRTGGSPTRTAPRRPNRRNAGLRCLADFVVGPSNQLAFTAAKRVAEDPTATELSPLFIYGECGVGKTHLLQGTAQAFAAWSKRGDAVRYVTAEQFTNEYINAVRGNTIDAFRKRTRRLDLLAIDDVHFLSNKVATQNEFLHTIDAIDLAGCQVVLASDEHPRRLGFGQALSSRFVAGMVVKIERPDRATRIRLIHKLAASRRFRISDAAAETIAARCAGSVRELEGAVNKLAALRLLSDGPEQVGLVLVEQLFADGSWRPKTPLRIDAVVDEVCARLVVNRAELMGTVRHRRVVAARGLITYLARELTTLSYPEIAQALGRKHHSTVHTAAKRVARDLREQRRIDVGENGDAVTLNELVDQLRHQILRAARKP